MGFGELKNKARELFGQHGDKAEQGVDKAGDTVKDRVGHDEQADEATDEAKDVLGNPDDQNCP